MTCDCSPDSALTRTFMKSGLWTLQRVVCARVCSNWIELLAVCLYGFQILYDDSVPGPLG